MAIFFVKMATYAPLFFQYRAQDSVVYQAEKALGFRLADPVKNGGQRNAEVKKS